MFLTALFCKIPQKCFVIIVTVLQASLQEDNINSICITRCLRKQRIIPIDYSSRCGHLVDVIGASGHGLPDSHFFCQGLEVSQ